MTPSQSCNGISKNECTPIDFLNSLTPEQKESIFNQINTEFTDYETVNEFGKYISGTKVNEAVVLFKRIDK